MKKLIFILIVGCSTDYCWFNLADSNKDIFQSVYAAQNRSITRIGLQDIQG